MNMILTMIVFLVFFTLIIFQRKFTKIVLLKSWILFIVVIIGCVVYVEAFVKPVGDLEKVEAKDATALNKQLIERIQSASTTKEDEKNIVQKFEFEAPSIIKMKIPEDSYIQVVIHQDEQIKKSRVRVFATDQVFTSNKVKNSMIKKVSYADGKMKVHNTHDWDRLFIFGSTLFPFDAVINEENDWNNKQIIEITVPKTTTVNVKEIEE